METTTIFIRLTNVTTSNSFGAVVVADSPHYVRDYIKSRFDFSDWRLDQFHIVPVNSVFITHPSASGSISDFDILENLPTDKVKVLL